MMIVGAKTTNQLLPLAIIKKPANIPVGKTDFAQNHPVLAVLDDSVKTPQGRMFSKTFNRTLDTMFDKIHRLGKGLDDIPRLVTLAGDRC